jgi:hypothetical protein
MEEDQKITDATEELSDDDDDELSGKKGFKAISKTMC